MRAGHDTANLVACAAEVRGDLFHPLERSIERPGPADVEVVLATPTEIIHVFEEPLGIFRHTVLKDGALHAPWMVPSADAPLSPVTYSTSVFSPTPSWSTASRTRPTWASVWAMNAAKTSMSRVATGLYLSG